LISVARYCGCFEVDDSGVRGNAYRARSRSDCLGRPDVRRGCSHILTLTDVNWAAGVGVVAGLIGRRLP
jgi:hypothetical protein